MLEAFQTEQACFAGVMSRRKPAVDRWSTRTRWACQDKVNLSCTLTADLSMPQSNCSEAYLYPGLAISASSSAVHHHLLKFTFAVLHPCRGAKLRSRGMRTTRQNARSSSGGCHHGCRCLWCALPGCRRVQTGPDARAADRGDERRARGAVRHAQPRAEGRAWAEHAPGDARDCAPAAPRGQADTRRRSTRTSTSEKRRASYKECGAGRPASARDGWSRPSVVFQRDAASTAKSCHPRHVGRRSHCARTPATHTSRPD
jgi:hypothetical protein